MSLKLCYLNENPAQIAFLEEEKLLTGLSSCYLKVWGFFCTGGVICSWFTIWEISVCIPKMEFKGKMCICFVHSGHMGHDCFFALARN